MNKFLLILFFIFSCNCCHAFIYDEIAAELPARCINPEYQAANYNFESTTRIPIKIKLLERIKSEDELYEGQIIDFKVAETVIYDDKIIAKRGDAVKAKVSLIITPGMNGIPASIVFSDFKIDTINSGQLSNTYEIFGQDRSLWVFPLKWALTILPPTGSLTNFIMGGHAKMKPKKAITIYYYPDWK